MERLYFEVLWFCTFPNMSSYLIFVNLLTQASLYTYYRYEAEYNIVFSVVGLMNERV